MKWRCLSIFLGVCGWLACGEPGADAPSTGRASVAFPTADGAPAGETAPSTAPDAGPDSAEPAPATTSDLPVAAPAEVDASPPPELSPEGPPTGFCPPLAPASGKVVEVASAAELVAALDGVGPDATLALADGTYALGNQPLVIAQPGVTLRGASGDREAVVLDGQYQGWSVVTVRASQVTLADLTIRRAYDHGVHVAPEAGPIAGFRLYNVIVQDARQQAVKVNPVAQAWPDAGEIACSLIELTDSGRTAVEDNCYTGGVDAHRARGWHVRDNLIRGFWCPAGLSEHGIHFWRGTRDTLIERNRLVDNARGIGLGLDESADGRTYTDDPCPAAWGYVGDYDGVVRNNVITVTRPEIFASQDGADGGVALAQACGARVVHNTIMMSSAPFASIEWRYPNTSALVANNLASHAFREREGAQAELVTNLEAAIWEMFSDPDGMALEPGAWAAIDQGTPLAAGVCDQDILGSPRDAAPDLGAHER